MERKVQLQIQRERIQLRRIFSRTASELENDLKTYEDTKICELKLKEKFEYLTMKKNELASSDKQILEELSIREEFDEDEYQSEYDKCENYSLRYINIKCRYEEYIVKNKNKGEKHQVTANINLRLPKVEINKFNDDPKTWLLFWGQYKKIHENTNIDNIDKFQYLIQSLQENSNARRMIESYPPSSENYDKAVTQLQSRFGKTEVLIEIYIRELLGMVLEQARGEQPLNLRDLFDKLTTYLHSLDSLGITKSRYDAFLYPLIESAIPENILLAWNRSAMFSQGEERLANLLQFVNNEVETEERIKMARPELKTDENQIPTINCFTTKSREVSRNSEGKDIFCIFCDKKNHVTKDCKKAGDLSLETKSNIIKEKGHCFYCLKKGHIAKRCKTFVKCLKCKKRHLYIMCPDLHKVNKESVLLCHNTTTFIQTVIVNIKKGNKDRQVRALLDTGSQRSYIRKNIVKELNLDVIRTERVGHTLFGGIEKEVSAHRCIEFEISALDHSFKINVKALEQERLCGILPKVKDEELIRKLHKLNIELTDTMSDINDISVLIGADYLNNILTGTLVHIDDSLCAINTKLGWTLQGTTTQTPGIYYTTVLQSQLSNNKCLSDLWSIELLGIKEPLQQEKEKDEVIESIKNFKESIKKNEEGRYEVRLLWKNELPSVSTNYDLAFKRMVVATKKLKKLGYMKEYNDVLLEWEKEGIIEEVKEDNINEGHYLPHHPVIKESSNTTKIRPVFDASAKDQNGWSLNDCMRKGLNTIELIPKLLLNFRRGAYGVTSDIKKAFLNIALTEQDKKYLKFLWLKNIEDDINMEVKTYRHNRVVFGVVCSPFLLGATINHHLENCSLNYSNTTRLLKESFYVDNCVLSIDNEAQLKSFIKEAKEIMSKGGFDLCQWVTAPSTSNQHNIVTVLGMQWNTVSDDLRCNIKTNHQEITGNITKRDLLSITQQVFDPLGIISPVTLVPKLIMQKAWLSNTGWDEPVSSQLKNEFNEWLSMLHYIEQCHFPRWLSQTHLKDCDISLHMFSDASMNAYAGCIYLRTQYRDKVYVQLVMAKGRVAPTKRQMSLPRLELMAALITSRLYVEVMKSRLLEGHKHETYCWTDSTVVLAWIKRNSKWKTFVSNRITEICENTKKEWWYHLPGILNPADLPSRGCNAKKYFENRWWEGPKWLYEEQSKWPRYDIKNLSIDEDTVKKEEKKEVTVNTDICHEIFSERLLYFSQYNKIVRMIAWILRFYKNIRREKNTSEYINNEEFLNAELRLIKLLQEEYFKNSKLKNLCIIKDEKGIMRIKTRLEKSQESNDYIYPILLPGNNEIIKRLVIQRHIILGHAGSRILMTDLRNTYWILNIRRLTKKVVSECVICKKFRNTHYVVPEAPLPVDRIDGAAAFQITGIDLAGPLYIKNGGKCWIVLFTCATYRAIHLELVESLSTESFIMALRRFIARRGRVNIIYTDNGTNFQGTANLLKELDWSTIEASTYNRAIKWKFIPPGAPWWGGWWERLIRSVKDMLKRILGKSCVTWIELSTILCECEAVINSRPLTYVTTDDDGALKPLTPQMFIQSLPGDENIDLDQIDEQKLGLRFKYLLKLRRDFKQRFKNEYLSLLVCKGKQGKYKYAEVGDVVLIESNLKRIHWQLGIIKELYTGKDGFSRVAKLKTSTGEKVRAIQRLYPLELSVSSSGNNSEAQEEIQNITQEATDSVNKSRHGRVINIPKKLLDYILTY